MRILVTGSSGFLGCNLLAELAGEHQLFAGYRSNPPASGDSVPVRFDVAERGEVERAFARARPELVVHAAALSKPDACERDPEEARRVIVDGTRHVVEAARAHGARAIVASTDLVFDGARGRYREDDPVGATSVYGRVKIEAERHARAIDPSCVIVRLALMYGRGNARYGGFLDAILARWRAGEPMLFYTDQYRTPLLVSEVGEAIRRLARQPEVSGLLHLGGADRLSRYEFALVVAELVGASPGLVEPGSMREGGPAPRGADCSLVSERARTLLGLEPLPCRAGLERLRARGQLEKLEPRPEA